MSEAAIKLGANAAAQAACFGICLAIGVAAGAVALLYFRKASPLERVLTDLFATVVLGAIFLVCVEFILGGKPELYAAVAYALGVAVIPCLFNKIRRRIKKRDEKKH